MLTNRLHRRTAHSSSRGGFTLVELLVVIGIIAILAGVALGPITNGIKKAQQSSGVQTCRTLGLAEFQYANDNNQTYPAGSSDASDVAKLLLAGNYASDPSIFYIGGSAETKYNLSSAASTNITKAYISYDFVIQGSGTGLNSNTPDQCPVVMSCVGATLTVSATTGNPVTLTTGRPFGTSGVAIGYHSNNAKFIIATAAAANLTDPNIPAVTAITLPGGG